VSRRRAVNLFCDQVHEVLTLFFSYSAIGLVAEVGRALTELKVSDLGLLCGQAFSGSGTWGHFSV
jgi:hypothetical protein